MDNGSVAYYSSSFFGDLHSNVVYFSILQGRIMMPRIEVAGQCGCGRSPTGKCCGWHALTEEAYKVKKDEYDLAEYQKQAAAIWSDSCTSGRSEL